MEVNCRRNRVLGPSVYDLRTEEFNEMIKGYKKFVASCYGAYGHSYLLTNPTGHTKLANSSLNINDNVVFNHPVIKFINAFVMVQNETFGLFGSYLGILCCGLLDKAITQSDMPWYQLQLVADKIINYLNGYLDNKVRTKLDIGNLKDVCEYVRAMMFSKGDQYCLHECDDIIIAIVKAFITTLPTGLDDKFAKVYVLPFEEYCVTKLLPGFCLHLPDTWNGRLITKKNLKCLKILVFNCPIDFAVPEAELLRYERYSKESLHGNLVGLLLGVINEWNIDAIFCQKFIGEEIKFDLERANITYFERLGLEPTCSLVDVAHCLPLSSLNSLEHSINGRHIGYVSLLIEEINEKCFLIIQNVSHSRDSTLIISETVTTGGNIKKKIESCLKILRLTAASPFVLPGAGCFEASCILRLLHMSIESLSDELAIPQSMVHKVLKIFLGVFADVCIKPTCKDDDTILNYAIDIKSGHLWKSEGEYFHEDVPVLESCTCHAMKKSGYFLPLSEIINYDGTFMKDDFLCTDNIGNMSDSVGFVDYYAAKQNAISLAFNAFLQLYSVEKCTYNDA